MKEYNFISKALTHISDKGRRRQVECELYDHIDEAKCFFEEIGYDESASAERAEGVMGDADIVGEQLETAVRRRSRTAQTVLSLAFLFLTVCGLAFLGYVSSAWDMYNRALTPSEAFIQCRFPAFAGLCASFVINLVFMQIGAKSKRIVSTTSGFIGALLIILVGSHTQLGWVYYFRQFKKYGIIHFFFIKGESPYIYNNASEKAIILISSALLIALFAMLLWVFIRTKYLQNTKTDLKIKSIVLILLFIISLCVSAFCIYTVSGVIQSRSREMREADSQLKAVEAIIENNAETLMSNIYNLDETATSLFNGYSVYADTQSIEMDSYQPPHYLNTKVNGKYKADFVSIDICTYDFENNVFRIYLMNSFTDPFSLLINRNSELTLSEKKLNDIEINTDLSIQKAPVPYNYLCEFSQNECNMILSYGEGVYILYNYNKESKAFAFDYSPQLEFTQCAELTPEHTREFEKAIIKNDVTQTNFRLLYYDLYGIYYYEPVNAFKIDYEAGYYQNLPQYSGLDIEIIGSVIIRFEDGEAKVLYTYNIEGEKTENERDEKIKASFNEDSYSRYEKGIHPNKDTASLIEKQLTNMKEALDCFEEATIPKDEAECIEMALEADGSDDLESLRVKPMFYIEVNPVYTVEIGTGYNYGPMKWLKYIGDACMSGSEYAWFYDVYEGMTLDEFEERMSFVSNRFHSMGESLSGYKIITLEFLVTDEDAFVENSYIFKDGKLVEIQDTLKEEYGFFN